MGESRAGVEGCLESEESGDGVDLWAMVTRMMAVPVALDSGSGRSPGSPCCSCCSGGCWRWEVEEVVHCEVVCRSWSRLGSPRGYEWAFAEAATVVWVASALSMASISARSSVWGKAQSLISSPCSFSSACWRAKEALATDSPLASPVWASESPIVDPCWSVISDLPQTIYAERHCEAHSRRAAPGLVMSYFAVTAAKGLERTREASRTNGNGNRRLII